MPPTKLLSEYKCEYCSYYTHRKSFMSDHIRVHTGEKPFNCETCGKCFSQKSNLRQHLKVHNQGTNANFQCTKCDFSTKWKSSLQVHDRMHNGIKPYKCKICDRAFSQSTHCQTHMREAHLNMRKFQCHICSKTFKRSEHLDRHLAFHKMERNYECEICHKKYLDARYLKQHKLIHLGEASKIYLCPLCPYKSRYKQGLRIHNRTHTGLRPYKCEDCSKTFVTKQSVKLHHRMVHQGMSGKIFKCEHCSFKTANKQSLKNHLHKIHLGKAEKVALRCKFCSKKFKTKSEYDFHQQTTHPRQMREENRLRDRLKVKVIGSVTHAGKVSPEAAVAKTKAKIMRKLRKRAMSPHPPQAIIQTMLPEQPVIVSHFSSSKAPFSQPKVSPAAKEEIRRAEMKLEGTLGTNQQVLLGQNIVTMTGRSRYSRIPINSQQSGGSSSSILNSPFTAGTLQEIMNIKKEIIEPLNLPVEEDDGDDDDVIIVDLVESRESRKAKNAVKIKTEPGIKPKAVAYKPSVAPRKPTVTVKKPPAAASKQVKHTDFLRIKLNTPKVTRVKASKLNGMKKQQVAPAVTFSLRGAKKLPDSPSHARPSSERARQLFMSPDIYMDNDSDISPLNITPDDDDDDDDDVQIIDEQFVPTSRSKSRQYDSLRAIISEYEEISTPSASIKQEILNPSDFSGQNGETVQLHLVKQEAMNIKQERAESEILPEIDLNQTSLDLSRVKAEPVVF